MVVVVYTSLCSWNNKSKVERCLELTPPSVIREFYCSHALTIIINDGYSCSSDAGGDPCDNLDSAGDCECNLKLLCAFSDDVIDDFHFQIILGGIGLDDKFTCGHSEV